jgi:hypothetical protein
MAAGVRTNEVGLVAQDYTTLDQRLFQILYLLEVAVGHAFVAHAHRLSEGKLRIDGVLQH